MMKYFNKKFTKQEEIEIYKIAIMELAKQLNHIYDEECCEYGDKYAGDDAKEIAFNYVKYAAQKFYYGDENDEIL